MVKVSVLIPVYNASSFLRESISSILNQTFTDFELILLNDASTDNSREIIKEFKDPRIRYYENKQNLGISISDYIREKKIEKATHLLRYSDKSIIDIANYLSFSSQSHFIQTFENFTGMTPKKYRNKYYKSMW